MKVVTNIYCSKLKSSSDFRPNVLWFVATLPRPRPLTSPVVCVIRWENQYFWAFFIQFINLGLQESLQTPLL